MDIGSITGQHGRRHASLHLEKRGAIGSSARCSGILAVSVHGKSMGTPVLKAWLSNGPFDSPIENRENNPSVLDFDPLKRNCQGVCVTQDIFIHSDEADRNFGTTDSERRTCANRAPQTAPRIQAAALQKKCEFFLICIYFPFFYNSKKYIISRMD